MYRYGHDAALLWLDRVKNRGFTRIGWCAPCSCARCGTGTSRVAGRGGAVIPGRSCTESAPGPIDNWAYDPRAVQVFVTLCDYDPRISDQL